MNHQRAEGVGVEEGQSSVRTTMSTWLFTVCSASNFVKDFLGLNPEVKNAKDVKAPFGANDTVPFILILIWQLSALHGVSDLSRDGSSFLSPHAFLMMEPMNGLPSDCLNVWICVYESVVFYLYLLVLRFGVLFYPCIATFPAKVPSGPLQVRMVCMAELLLNVYIAYLNIVALSVGMAVQCIPVADCSECSDLLAASTGGSSLLVSPCHSFSCGRLGSEKPGGGAAFMGRDDPSG